ncbi:hypothetical protein AVEN_101308-1 [Araneus ventricosus]|uniref:Uncharacterized protein n=1 Tax=Araneus ventricosus TaxID=182803 RepID=A0A4Y2IDC0_ARAVE|nr:hypothetical protein AVEN_101308-1 [Araneus ventricosus]
MDPFCCRSKKCRTMLRIMAQPENMLMYNKVLRPPTVSKPTPATIHPIPPTPQLGSVWYRSVATCKVSRLKIQKMLRHLEENQDLFRINYHTFQ